MNTRHISKLKKSLNLTNKDLSEKTGIPLSTVNKICSGQLKKTSYANLSKLSKVLNCHPADLVLDNPVSTISKEEEVKAMIIDNFGSLNKFADVIGLPLSTISRILNDGFKSATLGKLSFIFKQLNLSFDSLIYFDKISLVQPRNDLKMDIIENLNSLNSLGLSRVNDYIDDILEIEKYKECDEKNEWDPKSYSLYYNKENTRRMFHKITIDRMNKAEEALTRRARNDFENSEEEQKLMEEDFEMMKKIKDKNEL